MKVTLEEVKAAVKRISYTLLPDSTTTICQLTLDNGWTVTGQSACVDPAEFNQLLGEKYALEDAENKIWPFLGFRLADKLYAEQKTKDESKQTESWLDRLELEEFDLQSKLQKLSKFLQDVAAGKATLPKEEHDDLVEHQAGMQSYLTVLQKRLERNGR